MNIKPRGIAIINDHGKHRTVEIYRIVSFDGLVTGIWDTYDCYYRIDKIVDAEPPATKAPRKSIATAEFERQHGRKPRGRGGWVFQNRATGEEFNADGTYAEAKKTCPAGEWTVCP